MAEKSCEECQQLAPAMDFNLFTGYFLWDRPIIYSIKLNFYNRFAITFTHFVQVYLCQKLATSGEHVEYKNCPECQNQKQFMNTSCSPDVLSLKFSIFMKNLSSYCGLVDTKIRASEIDLPVYQIVSVTICVQNA